MGRRYRVDGIGGRPADGGGDAESGNTGSQRAAGARGRRYANNGQDPCGQDGPPQRWVPRRTPAEKYERPCCGGEEGGTESDPGDELDPTKPQVRAPHPGQRTHRRGQYDRVVGVDDALRVAEDQPGQEKPAAEQQEGGTNMVRTWRPAGQPQHGNQANEGPGDEPRDLAAERLVEQAIPAGRAPHRAGRPAATDTALFIAAESADAVVAEDEVEHAVVGRAADSRA